MPLTQRKRRAPVEDEPNPSPPRTQRRRASRSGSSSPADATQIDPENDTETIDAQFTKKLVRYALACEFARLPIRRDGIKEKVFGKHSGRSFQKVFGGAQKELRRVWGMEMEELPLKEKTSLKDRRAQAQKGGISQVKGSGAWVLTSILPQKMRDVEIVGVNKAPSEMEEASYVGLYTFVIACIGLGNGSISNEKLLRNLRRLNAEENTPVDTTEALLAKMVRQGYVVKVKDNSAGEEMINWVIGPRGKIEVGEKGIAGMARAVYGDGAPEDLEQRLAVSLGTKLRVGGGEADGDAESEVDEVEQRRSGRVIA